MSKEELGVISALAQHWIKSSSSISNAFRYCISCPKSAMLQRPFGRNQDRRKTGFWCQCRATPSETQSISAHVPCHTSTTQVSLSFPMFKVFFPRYHALFLLSLLSSQTKHWRISKLLYHDYSLEEHFQQARVKQAAETHLSLQSSCSE